MTNYKNEPLLEEQKYLLNRVMHNNAQCLAAVQGLGIRLKSLTRDVFGGETDPAFQLLETLKGELSGAQYDVTRLLKLSDKQIEETQTAQLNVVECVMAALIRTHPDQAAFCEAFSKIWDDSSAASTYQDVPSARITIVGMLAWLEHHGGAALSVPLQIEAAKRKRKN